MSRLDALSVREYQDSTGQTKAAFTKIGTAFPNKNGGYTLILDALPLPALDSDGRLQTKLLLKEPQPRDGAARQPARGGGGAFADDLDDDVAF